MREILTSTSCLDDLLPYLKRLDSMLEEAVALAGRIHGQEGAADSFRGLHIGQGDVERLLGRQPGAPTLHVDGETGEPTLPEGGLDNHSRLKWLAQTFGLSSFDLDLMLLALAPEFDLRYERLYAYLQDDVNRRRPTVDLALNLLCSTSEEKLGRREHFSSTAPLIQHSLLRLISDPHQLQPPLLSHYLKLDEQVISFLLGQETLDPRLVTLCRMVTWNAFPSAAREEAVEISEQQQALLILVRQAMEARRSLKLYFHGPRSSWTLLSAEAVVRQVGLPLLVLDLPRAVAAQEDFEQILKLAFREATFHGAILCLDGVDALRTGDRTLHYERFLDLLAHETGITMLTGVEAWIPSGCGAVGVISVPVAIPDFSQRRAYWHHHLKAADIPLDASDLDALASRFRLMPDQIAETVVTASNLARWRTAVRSTDERLPLISSHTNVDELFAAARAQSSHDLAKLVCKVEVKYTLDDIVLPPDQLAQLKEICDQAKHRHIVLGEWGFDRKLSSGKGLNVLFAGQPGTGKTMGAEVIASALHLDLYKIDLSQVVSKYIGETEKNLDRIFTAAHSSNAFLFFDEADALFGKRSEVRDAHDRYANIEVGYLLQKMEEYAGIVILASNLCNNMDDAFTRRLQYLVEFPFPDDLQRQRIWEKVFPEATPLANDVDYAFLATQFKVAGGHIKNVALSAAFLAAADGASLGMSHLIRAMKREYQKLGKVCAKEEFGPYYNLVRKTHG